jgi:hypothetical protein
VLRVDNSNSKVWVTGLDAKLWGVANRLVKFKLIELKDCLGLDLEFSFDSHGKNVVGVSDWTTKRGRGVILCEIKFEGRG